MESNGAADKVNISEKTHDLLVGTHLMEPRGELDIKGKGKMNCFWLTGRELDYDPPEHLAALKIYPEPTQERQAATNPRRASWLG